MSKNNLIVVGIDQSYEDTGITISMNGEVKSAISLKLKNEKSNSVKRGNLRDCLINLFFETQGKAIRYNASVMVIIERIRLRSDGFININYIKSIGALNAVICDCAYGYGFPVYSVDTRAWKNCVIGTTKAKENKYGINPKKFPTIIWCIKHGYKNYIKETVESNRKTKGVIEKNGERYIYNDNVADSICISLCGFSIQKKLLKKEG